MIKRYEQAKEEFNREYFRQLVAFANGKHALAAMVAGINRTHYYKLLRRYGPRPHSPRQEHCGHCGGHDSHYKTLQEL